MHDADVVTTRLRGPVLLVQRRAANCQSWPPGAEKKDVSTVALTVLVGCSCCGFCSCWVAAGLLLGALLAAWFWFLGWLLWWLACCSALLGSGDKERDREREAAVLSML